MATESKLISNWTPTKKKVSTAELYFDFPHHHDWMHRFIHASSPHSNSYSSPVPGVFLVDLENFSTLNKAENWVIRDGLLPLLHFFEKNPTPPKSLKSTLLFDRALAAIVPKAWQKTAKTRSLISLREDPSPAKMLVPGMMCPQYTSLEDSRIALWQACSYFEKYNKKIQEVALFTPLRIVDYRSQNDDVYAFNFVSQYINTFGEKVQLLNFEAFQNQFNYSDYFVLDTNSKFLISDSYCLHHCLTAGGVLINFKRPKEAGEVIYLSPFHGYYVEEEFPEVSAEDPIHLSSQAMKNFSQLFMS